MAPCKSVILTEGLPWVKNIKSNQIKIKSIMGKFSKVCANAEHEAWNSSSPTVINLHGKVGRNDVFFSKYSSKRARKDQRITSAPTALFRV